jgi:hypothetical protein
VVTNRRKLTVRFTLGREFERLECNHYQRKTVPGEI